MHGAGRIITCDADVAEGAAWLARQDARWADVMRRCAPLPLRRRPDGFPALLFAIISQQISVASATATWHRIEEAGLSSEDAVARADDDLLRSVGFSRQKMRYARALAHARIDYAGLRTAPTEEVVARLTEVPGIGVWTAEIYAMFSLGHADVFAPGDLAMQEAARMLFDLPDRPRERDFRAMAKEWSPWRSVAARGLWAYYQLEKNREGIG